MKKKLIIFLSFVSFWTSMKAQVGAFGLQEFNNDINRIILNSPRNPENKLIIQVSPFQKELKGKYAWSEKYTLRFINDSIFSEKSNLVGFTSYWLIRNDTILSYDLKYKTVNRYGNRYSRPDSMGYECFEGITGFNQKKFKSCRKRDHALRNVELIYIQDSIIGITRFEYPNINIRMEKHYFVIKSDTVLMNSVYQYNAIFQNQSTITDTTIIRRYNDDTNPMNIILTVKKYSFGGNGQITDIEKCLFYDNSSAWAERSIMTVIRKKKR